MNHTNHMPYFVYIIICRKLGEDSLAWMDIIETFEAENLGLVSSTLRLLLIVGTAF